MFGKKVQGKPSTHVDTLVGENTKIHGDLN